MSNTKMSREEWRKAKDLDAARKAGTAMPEIDEDGKYINPHTPAYLVKAPWYVDSGKPSLKHHKKPDDGKLRPTINDHYDRGQTAKAATKFRKGACENCGAMTHKARDCLERPRKKGAKWTGKNIAPDELTTAPKAEDFDSKRDRWSGYDPSQHTHVMQEYEAVEEERRKLREEEIDKQTSTDLTTAKKLARKTKSKAPKADGDFGSSDEDEDDDEDKYAEKSNMAGQKVNADTRITVRNLRIREDRAKYLYNLDPDSAYYDPKTRSMREAPDPTVRPEDAEFAGDNFVRGSGDVNKIQQLQMFAWQSEARGNDVHLQANPTMNELQHREYQQKKEKLRESTKGSILERYGGAEHFDSVPKELLTGQTEDYVEYTQTGQAVRPQSRLTAPKGDEKKQVYDGNHTMPWGTYFDSDSGKYGYDCCHSLIRNSYCTGKAGIEAAESSANLLKGKAKAIEEAPSAAAKESTTTGAKRRARSSSTPSGSSGSSRSYSSDSDSDSSSSSARHRRKRSKRSSHRKSGASRRRSRRSEERKDVSGYKPSKGMGEGDVSARLDKSKLKAALREEERRERGGDSAGSSKKKPDWLLEAEQVSKKANKYDSLRADDAEVTEEQLEAYRMKQKNQYEDPMANYRDESAA